MTDVLKIALERRAELERELAKLDDFIRMAEALLNRGGSIGDSRPPDASGDGDLDMPLRPARVPEGGLRPQLRRGQAEEEPSTPHRPQVIRRSQAGNGG